MMINTVWRETASCTAEVNVAPILRNIATRNALHNTTSCISGLKQIPVCVIYFVIHCIYLLGCVLFVLFCLIFYVTYSTSPDKTKEVHISQVSSECMLMTEPFYHIL